MAFLRQLEYLAMTLEDFSDVESILWTRISRPDSLSDRNEEGKRKRWSTY